MKPVHQTVFGKNKGNCISACFASLLERDLEEIPCFVRDYGAACFEKIQEWLGKEHGMFLLRIIMPRDAKGEARGIECTEDFRFHAVPECLCMATGRSPRGDWNHIVVGKIVNGYNFELVHDPHPDGKGITGFPICIEFLVPLNIKRNEKSHE